ncbi:MAG: GIY-YIG nuclease family protein [Bacteroidota bacterium]
MYCRPSRASGAYVGQTSDLARRLDRHNNSLVPSTRPYCPWKVVYSEASRQELRT